MITFLELKNYRAFQQYRLENLKAVNLLAGMNNCGKTSVLEAIMLLAYGANMTGLNRILRDRGELVREDAESAKHLRPDASHLFFDHDIDLGKSFTIVADRTTLGKLHVSVARMDSEEKQPYLFMHDQPPGFGLFLTHTSAEGEARSVWPIQSTGGLSDREAPIAVHTSSGDVFYQRQFRANTSPDLDVHLITPSSLFPAGMSDMWDSVIIEGKERDVIESLRIIDPQIEGVFFLSNSDSRRPGRAGAVVSQKGKAKRVPLGSYGDGIRRLLALALVLTRAADGVLLVDEIDTGFHYSIMNQMWQLVVRTALSSNIQIFATTHSLDCIRGLASLCEADSSLADSVSYQKLDRNLNHAVSLSGDQLVSGAMIDFEMR